MHIEIWENILGKEKTKCKAPEVEILKCSLMLLGTPEVTRGFKMKLEKLQGPDQEVAHRPCLRILDLIFNVMDFDQGTKMIRCIF